jgi:hypothetical protein
MELHDYRFIYHRVGDQLLRLEASDQDTSDSRYQYFGFLSIDGAWLIQRFDIVGDTIAYRYTAGQGSYSASWAAKATWAEATWKYYNQISCV